MITIGVRQQVVLSTAGTLGCGDYFFFSSGHVSYIGAGSSWVFFFVFGGVGTVTQRWWWSARRDGGRAPSFVGSEIFGHDFGWLTCWIRNERQNEKKNSQTVNKKRTKEVERKKIKKTKPDRRARLDDPNRRNELSLTDRRAEVLMCRQRIRSSFFVFGVFFRLLFYYYYFFFLFFFLFGLAWLPNKLPAIQRFTINRTMAAVRLRTRPIILGPIHSCVPGAPRVTGYRVTNRNNRERRKGVTFVRTTASSRQRVRSIPRGNVGKPFCGTSTGDDGFATFSFRCPATVDLLSLVAG